MILGIDAGNYETKVCTGTDVKSFLSDIGEYRERKLTDSFGDDDMVWEFEGEKGFAGTLARFESEYSGTIKGKTKAHLDGKLRVLMALHRYGDINNSIVVGQPIEMHDETEKDKLKKLLKGRHELTLNGVKKIISVNNIGVAPEGASSILSVPQEGLVRVIDIGSGTTNFATLHNLRKVDKSSFTEQIGTEIFKNKDPKQIARVLYKIVTASWGVYDKIYLTGGGAKQVYPHLEELLSNCELLIPKLNNARETIGVKYGNAVGFYIIAKGLFRNG